MSAGVVNFGIQGSLFIFLLYALLAAETDPLSYTIKVLVRFCSAWRTLVIWPTLAAVATCCKYALDS